MPSIWDTSLPETDANLYKSAIDEDSWAELLKPAFFEGYEGEWTGFWEEYGDKLTGMFNYGDRYGASEALSNRQFNKGLELFTNKTYDNLNKNMRKHANLGFAGSGGGGVGFMPSQSSLWSDYQMGLQEKKNDQTQTLYGFGEQFKGEVNSYLGSLASEGVFDFV